MKQAFLVMVLKRVGPVVLGAAGAFLASEYTTLFNAFCQGGV